ncbi:hypothetical protein PZA11_005717 [Diplocarpon coronariae]|uniref:Mitochondrial AAA ATPase n=1 Tax=Diplocarpon coronariae TaxID=2795749 RepID=A0A218Z519_9HELO|nr:hypothetical protein JHW43_002772 [Diplocarpon mali]OWP02345.1 mitochondrial AAA ATPase [Marssonina coronariae]
MHAVALQALRTAQRPITRRACRTVAGARHPLPHRKFHRSPVSYEASADPTAGPAAETGNSGRNPEKPELESEEAKPENGTAEEINTSTEVGNPASKTTKARTGGRLRGVVRQKEPDGLPPVVLPEWFYKNNIKPAGRSEKLGASLAVFGSGAPASGDQEGDDAADLNAEIARQSTEISECGLETTDAARYSINVDVYREILATLKAGLALRPPKNATNSTILRPVTVLQCPKDGGSYYLDSIVETIASKLDSDLIRLNAQDLAQIAGPYVDGNLAWHFSRTALLAYDAHKEAGIMEDYDKELDEMQDSVDGAEDEEGPYKKFVEVLKRAGMQAGVVAPGADGKRRIIQQFAQNLESGMRPPPPPPADTWNDIKMANILDEMISAADTTTPSGKAANDIAHTKPKPLIVQIQDYKEISQVSDGAVLLRKLRAAVNKKWQEGRDIIIVGTTTAEGGPVLSRPDIQHLQSDIVDGEKRTILVPPDRREHQDVAFEADEKVRLRSINVRNIEEMVLKLVDGSKNLTLELDIERDLDSATVFSAGLEDAVWTYARVHRIATTILGLLEEPLVTIDGAVFSKALKVLSASDQAKFIWGAAELKQEEEEVVPSETEADTVTAEKKKAKDKLKEIRKKCTPHEVKLLSGVVLSSDIRTTFADVRAPKDTVEALKTLTSLSLLRPEAFSYGVLASDKIPGVLLYGPPGTGKTLLAKAVAKESGATVLEVTAADLNDMFVGQGEKNVRAVFKLAKKLSPCVVFIDEADAIFSARGEHNRNSHREMINQFLREWDGMNDFSAFIMVATNRPFDLDEAVLRRLPRRLLVDLPVQKDREEILKIHLKDEVLDDSVSLTKLAQDTPFYSGSDLKNLSVAAAMACIREENAVAAQHSGEEAYVYPEKRILKKAHFDKALEEISASVSEDMSTLTAIRKFDQKYGDRKGRKKKGPGLGFGGTTLEQKDSEAARVRKIEAQ